MSPGRCVAFIAVFHWPRELQYTAIPLHIDAALSGVGVACPGQVRQEMVGFLDQIGQLDRPIDVTFQTPTPKPTRQKTLLHLIQAAQVSMARGTWHIAEHPATASPHTPQCAILPHRRSSLIRRIDRRAGYVQTKREIFSLGYHGHISIISGTRSRGPRQGAPFF